jgi:hypothetical protein
MIKKVLIICLLITLSLSELVFLQGNGNDNKDKKSKGIKFDLKKIVGCKGKFSEGNVCKDLKPKAVGCIWDNAVEGFCYHIDKDGVISNAFDK